QGNRGAQCYLGHCYQYGIGVDINEEVSFGWYLKSAEGGYAEAFSHIGDCYLCGKGVDIDVVKAWEWYARTAQGGMLGTTLI
ncbi:10442_t:CDS:1, partial [Funneliformis caledonium]